jgi:hypothetical protein
MGRIGQSVYNPLDEVDTERLRDSMSWSMKMMAPFREQYVRSVEYFAGSRFGDQHTLDMTPVNLLRLAVEVWVRQLVSQTPAVLAIARTATAQTSAYELEIAINYLLGQMKFGKSMAEVVRSALFMMGVMKVGLADSYLSQWSGYGSQAGQPYAEPVLVEDFLFDFNARRCYDWDWCGNRYRIPYSAVMDNPNFDKEVKARLSPGDERMPDGIGLGEGNDRTSDLSSGNSITKTEYRRYVELWDLWLPGDKLLVTLPFQQGLGPLEVRDWEGPESGPFHVLAFSTIPGNATPSGPAQQLVELQDLFTTLFNKLGRQAKRQKTITAASGAAEASGAASRIKDAQDGEIIVTDHVDSVKEMNYGKIDPANMQFVAWLKELFSYMAGNLDAMGGLSQQGDTLGQEQLLVQSSSQMLLDMQTKVVEYTREVITDLAWYMYSDPFLEMPLSKEIAGYGTIPFTWGPERRKADFFAHEFKVEPYSLQSKGPQQRLNSIMQIVTQVLLPLSPQMGEWGMQINLKKFVEIVAKYGDLPEINDLISSETAMQQQPGLAGQQVTPGRRPLQSPSTQRTYVRKNVSEGKNASAMESGLMKSMMSSTKES